MNCSCCQKNITEKSWLHLSNLPSVNEEGKKGPITAQAMKKKRGKEDVLKDYKEPSYSENPMTFGDKPGPTKPGG